VTSAVGTGKHQLSDLGLRKLRSLILSGELAPGQHLSETAAGELLGMSRTPAREVLAQLIEEGLLLRSGTGRCLVSRFTREDVIDGIELRGVMEGTVLRVAAERGADPQVLDALAGIADAIDGMLPGDGSGVDFDGYTALNQQFHDTLARLSGSPTLERELLRIYRLPLASPNAFLQSQNDVPAIRNSLFRAQAQHRAMIEAVRHREGSRAEALAREHARLARENLDYVVFNNRPLANRIPGLSLVSRTQSRAAPDNRTATRGRKE